VLKLHSKCFILKLLINDNMRKNLYIISCILFISLGFSSCELDRYPSSDIEQSQGFEQVSDIRKLVDGSYSVLRYGTYGRHMMTQDIQADLFHATLSYGNRYGLPYNWNNYTSSDYDLEAQWELNYTLISNLNNILDNVGQITPANDDESKQLAQYIGETYFMRAYAFSRLVERYAKDYDPATAATDPGIPLLLTFDPENKPGRSSIEDTYARIFDDIQSAKNEWAKVTWTGNSIVGSNKYRLTPDALSAFEARLYLYTHQWDKAISTANALIDGDKYSLIVKGSGTDDEFVEEFRKMWRDDSSTEIITQLYADGSKETPQENSNYTSYNDGLKAYTPDYVPEKWVYDLYDDSDVRKKVYFLNPDVNVNGTVFKDIQILNKYPQTTRFTSSGNTMHLPILFKISEMYLIVAEAGAQNTSTNATGLSRLNQLRQARGLAALGSLTGDALMDAVKEERTREMLAEGVRLTDLKRWGMGFDRSEPQNALAILVAGINLSMPAGSNKFVWGIPAIDMNLNPNLKGNQNPGW